MQNNLEEFYALINFVVPDLLGSASAFRRVFADPITASRDKAASRKDKEIGRARAGYVLALLNPFVLHCVDSCESHVFVPFFVS